MRINDTQRKGEMVPLSEVGNAALGNRLAQVGPLQRLSAMKISGVLLRGAAAVKRLQRCRISLPSCRQVSDMNVWHFV